MVFLKRFSALLLAAALVLGLAACSGGGGRSQELKLTSKEEERVISLARAFRIYGRYDSSEGFELNQYEYLVYSLSTCELPESEVAGYGRLSFEEADDLVSGVLGGAVRSTALIRTKYKANEIQVIYSIGERYYVMRTDDRAYSYEIGRCRLLTDDDGARIGIAVTVRVNGKDGDFSIALELLDNDTSVFSVRKSEIQNTI